MPNIGISLSKIAVSGHNTTIDSPELAAFVKTEGTLEAAPIMSAAGVKASDISVDGNGRVQIANADLAATVLAEKAKATPLDINIICGGFCELPH